jgi:hypothetical protein
MVPPSVPGKLQESLADGKPMGPPAKLKENRRRPLIVQQPYRRQTVTVALAATSFIEAGLRLIESFTGGAINGKAGKSPKLMEPGGSKHHS